MYFCKTLRSEMKYSLVAAERNLSDCRVLCIGEREKICVVSPKDFLFFICVPSEAVSYLSVKVWSR